MAKKLIDKAVVSVVNDTDNIFINQGNSVKQVSYDTLKTDILRDINPANDNTAFYIEPNNASSKGSSQIDYGGSETVRAEFIDNQIPILLDPQTGYYCELDASDSRYTADGTQVWDGSAITSGFEKAEWMGIIPKYYQFIEDVEVSNVTHSRVWTSFNPLVGGIQIPQQCVGMFKAGLLSSKLRSIPGVVPANSAPIYTFWNYAQNNNKNCGLAGIQFRTYLMHLLNARYGYRDCQGALDSSGTTVYGVGLDGSENTTSSTSDGFARQKSIKTGGTLSLGNAHGNVAETDSAGGTCHSVRMGCFENPWGQYWEFVGDLCSLASDSENRVVHMLENAMVTGTPTLESFTNIKHEILTRASAGDKTIVDAANQVFQILPQGALSGVDDKDGIWYNATGQVWIWGGRSDDGSACGLGCSYSTNAWSYSNSHVSARLAYFGALKKTTSAHLKELLAS